jgi:hypothetical protein
MDEIRIDERPEIAIVVHMDQISSSQVTYADRGSV